MRGNASLPGMGDVVALLVGMLLLAFIPLSVRAQAAPQAFEYDLLIIGGHVIDPKNAMDGHMDVAITNGRIARVAAQISESTARRVIVARGLYVVPGLVDMHGHTYYGTRPRSDYSNGFNAIEPDGFTFRSGVTTIVDAGGAGWREFHVFKEQVIDRAQTRVLAFINIVGSGMRGGEFEQDLNDMDPQWTAETAARYEEIVGVKLAHFVGHNWEPVHRAVAAGKRAGIPVMVDFGSADPPLPLEMLLLEKLRPGDIFTHTYARLRSREAIVDENDSLRPFVLRARERGIVFDVGHGASSFNFLTAIPAIRQGLKPDTISTDLHRNSMNAGMKDLLNVASKFLNLGMSLPEVIRAMTWSPARVIQRENLGHLTEGAEADLAVLRMREGEFGFLDARPGSRMTGTRRLEAELTVRAGRIVWDLNGISAPLWNAPEQ